MSLQDYNNIFSKALTKNVVLEFSDGTRVENDQIVSETFSLEESLCLEENLNFGTCESSMFSIRIAYLEHQFKDLYVDVSLEIKGFSGILATADGEDVVDSYGNYFAYKDRGTTTLKIGTYKVYSDKPTSDRVYRDLECYDIMREIIDIDVADWYSNLTFPMTLKAFRDSFFNEIGYVQETATLINDNYIIKGSFEAKELSSKDIIENICALNGVFGHINRDGKFEYISLPSSETVTYDHYINGSCMYQDYETETITGVASYTIDGNVGVTVGTEGNVFKIQNNLLMYGDEGTVEQETALTNLLNKISAYTYRPFEAETYGNPLLPVGTAVVFNTTHQTIESFVMRRYLTGIQAMRDHFIATGDKIYPSDINATQSVIKRTAGKVSYVEQKVDKLESYVGEWTSQGTISTAVTQMSNEYVVKVDSDGNIGLVRLSADPDTDMTSFDINADNISFKANSTLNMTAARLNISSSNFSVSSSGVLQAKSGKVGGWSLGESNFWHSTPVTEGTASTQYQINLNSPADATDSTIGIYVRKRDYDGSSYGSWSNTFYVRYDGYIRAMGGGTIGPFSFSAGTSATASLRSGMTSRDDTSNNGIWLGSDGIALGKGNFKVTNAGELTSKSGEIAGWTIGTNGLTKVVGDYSAKLTPGSVCVAGTNRAVTITPTKIQMNTYGSLVISETTLLNLTNLDDTSTVLIQELDNLYLRKSDGLYKDTTSNTTGQPMHGRASGHSYQCNWSGGNLMFYVDTTHVGNLSDKRLKHEIQDVDTRLIDIIGKCKMQQYKADNRGGKISFGIMAQDFVAECEKENIDSLDYEMLSKVQYDINDEELYYTMSAEQLALLRTVYLERELEKLRRQIHETNNIS